MSISAKAGPLVVVLGVASLIFAACAQQAGPAPKSEEARPGEVSKEQPVRGGVLQLGYDQYRSFDAQQETFYQVLWTNGPAYNTILQFDPSDPTDKAIIADLAERWEQPSPTTYVLYFRKGVKWHDGVEFTAADAKFTLERIASPPSGVVSHRKDWFRNIEKLELVDPYTLKINLKQPQASLLSFLAAGWVIVIPKHKVENDQEFLQRNILGTGPFKAKDIDFNVSVTLVRNENYFKKDVPYLDGIKITVLTKEAIFPAFRAKRRDLAGLAPQELETVKKEMPDVKIRQYPAISLSHFRFNHTRPPFNNVKVRQALHLAADRHSMIDGLVFGVGDLASSMPASGNWDIPQEELLKMPGFRKDKTEDLKRAKELLAEAGYPNGFSASLILGYQIVTDNMSLILQDQLKPLGIELVTRKLGDTPAYLTAMDKLDFEIAGYGLGSSIDDPDDMLAIMYRTGGGRNYGKFSDPEIDRLLDQQSAASDPVERKKMVREILLKVIEKVPQVNIYQSRGTSAWQPWVKNYIPHNSSYNHYKHEYTWIDKNLRP